MATSKNDATFIKHANSSKDDFPNERRDPRLHSKRGTYEAQLSYKPNYQTNTNSDHSNSAGYRTTHGGDISYQKSPFHSGDKRSSGYQKTQSHSGQNSSGYQKPQYSDGTNISNHHQSPCYEQDQNPSGYQKPQSHGGRNSSGYQKPQYGSGIQLTGYQKSQSHDGDKSVSNHQQSPSSATAPNSSGSQKPQYGGGKSPTGYNQTSQSHVPGITGCQQFKPYGDVSNQMPYMYPPINVPPHGSLISPLQSSIQQPTYGYNSSAGIYSPHAINIPPPQYGYSNTYNYQSHGFNPGHFGNTASYHHSNMNPPQLSHVMAQQPSLLNSNEKSANQENLDKEWVRKWTEKKKIQNNISALEEKKPNLKICEANTLIQRCLVLSDELKIARDKLKENIDDMSDEEWTNHMTTINKMKVRCFAKKLVCGKRHLREFIALHRVDEMTLKWEELLSNKNILSDPELIKKLQDKIKKRRKKRLWWRNRMKRRYLARNEDLERRETLHRQIDAWREKNIAEDLALRKEAMLKREAGGVLGEVRRKQADSRKLLEVLKSVKKLRDIRKSEGEKKGVYPKTSLEVDEKFKEKCDYLESFILKRVESYEDEEKALRVMLVEEEEEREKKEEKQRQEQRALLNITSKDNDALTSFQEYYGQAEKSLGYLIQIRREWDAYMVPDHIYGGSRIPDGEVQPCLPSSEVWSSALAANKDETQ